MTKPSFNLKAVWRILIFITLFSLSISPLVLIDNSYLQFAGAWLILIFGMYLNSKYLDKRDFQDYGLVFKKETFIHLIMGIWIGGFSVVLILLIGKETGIQSISRVFPITGNSILVPFAFKMLLVAILEESFFRGYLIPCIHDVFKSDKKSKGKAVFIALTISSLLFGLAHFDNDDASLLSISLLTINGMVWGIPFIMTKNLGLPIGLHAAWNFAQTQLGFTMSGNKATRPFYRIENSGVDLLTGGRYGPEDGVLGLIGFLLMLLLSLIYLRLRKRITVRDMD